MKKHTIYLIIGIVFILIIGVVSYQVMNNLEYFENRTIMPTTEDAVLIPLTSLIWAQFKQIIKMLAIIILGFVILGGIGFIL